MKKTAHIISHTHWDREWYINSKYTNEWLEPFFDSLFQIMDEQKDYTFVLDGQMSIVEDYLDQLAGNEEKIKWAEEQIRRFAAEGRLVIGPYYLQPDWQLVSGESLMRNMLIGCKMARKYGKESNVGWLLDNFGQISQAPQMHKQFGMKGLVLWRGVGMDPFKLNSEFIWESPDGTRMLSSYLLSSYRNAMRLATYPDIIYDRIQNEVNKIKRFATTNNVLLMNGYDQEMIPDDILPYIADGKADFDDFVVKQSTPEEYMDALLAEADPDKLHVLKGALYNGRYISVFPGILTSRMYLKMQNYFCQSMLEKYAEPVQVVNYLLGGKYESEALEKAWKRMLKNHPHDSICGVSVDDVHTDMEERFIESLEMSGGIFDKTVKNLAANVNTASGEGTDAVVVFNTSPYETTQLLTLPAGVYAGQDDAECEQAKTADGKTLVKAQLPAFGYTTLHRKEEVQSADNTEEKKGDSYSFENAFFAVTVNENGTLDVLEKKSQKWYRGLGAIEDCADAGDEYNYSDLTGDKSLYSTSCQVEVSLEEQNDLRTIYKIAYGFAVPESLSEDRSTRSEKKAVVPVETYVTMSAHEPVIRFRTEIDNRAKDHRMRVLFPTGIEAEESFAQTQFDITKHPIHPEVPNNEGVPEDVKRIIIGAREVGAITIFPQTDYCGITSDSATAAVLNRGLRDYEILDQDNTIAITLFRTIGWLARFDLNSRIGDAGPEIFVPDAQCLRRMSFEYAFYASAGTLEESAISKVSAGYQSPAVAVPRAKHEGVLPAQKSFLELTGDPMIEMSTCKLAENGQGLIVRLCNPTEEERTVQISMENGIRGAWHVAANEEVLECLDVAGAGSDKAAASDKAVCSVTCKIAAKEIYTVLLDAEIHETPLVESAGGEIIKEEGKSKGRSEELAFITGTNQPQFLVSLEEIDAENERASEREAITAELERRYRDKLAQQEKDPDNMQLEIDAAIIYKDQEANRRAALEARLSAVLSRKKYEQVNGLYDEARRKETEDIIRAISLDLNSTRLTKRASEYIVDYYNQKTVLS